MAALSSTAHAQDLGKQAGIDQVRTAGEALIAASGEPAAFTLEESTRRLIVIRHLASGLMCSLPLVDSKWLRATQNSQGIHVECGYQTATMGETWRVLPNQGQRSVDDHFNRWRDGMLQNNAAHGARIIEAEQPIEDHAVIGAIRANLPGTRRSGWIAAGQGSQASWIHFGVADIGPWRVTYIGDGLPDAVRGVAPAAWATTLSGIATAMGQ